MIDPPYWKASSPSLSLQATLCWVNQAGSPNFGCDRVFLNSEPRPPGRALNPEHILPDKELRP